MLNRRARGWEGLENSSKHNKDGQLLLQYHKKLNIGILFQKICLDWKLSQIINRQGVGIRMSRVENNQRLISGKGAGTSIKHSRGRGKFVVK